MRYLWVCDKGKQALRQRGYQVENDRGGGPEHEYWKHRVAEHFRKEGYQIELEVRLASSHIADGVAKKNEERIIFEVETGNSNEEMNARRISFRMG